MEIVGNGCCAIKSFISAVIEWRSAATAPYLMFINSAFWWSVFYLDKETQLRLLVSYAAGIFGWDILLSSTYDRSILFHILTWPSRSVIRTTSVIMALYSAQFLYWTEFEKACWTAYSAAILEKAKKELLRIKTAVRNTYVSTVAKLCAGKNAVLNVTKSTLFNIKDLISCTVYEFRIALRSGILYSIMTIWNGVVYTITSTKSGIVFVITFLEDGILSGYLALKNGFIGGILRLKNCLITGLYRSNDVFYYSIVITKNYIHYALAAIQNSISNFFSVVVRWIKTEIVKPVRRVFRAVIQFLQYWLCAHWWPNLRSWFILHVVLRLQLLFNYFCFGIIYAFCGYWINPFIAFLSRYFRRFYTYFQQSVLTPVEIWIRRQIDKALIYLKQLLQNLAIRVRDSILWPFFILLISLMNKARTFSFFTSSFMSSLMSFRIWVYSVNLVRACAHLYRILLQPIIDILYKKYKVCEDYLLIYYLGPVCQVFVDHIPKKSPFCDDTDTELADLLPPGFSSEESDIEETSDKPSLPSRSLSPFTEDERDFLRGLKFPNLDTSDSSEAEFALRPKSKFQKPLKKKPKAHPKDPAPSVCSDELISTAYKVQKDKQKHSSSTSSPSESVVSSSAQNASDDADPQNLDALDFESEDRRPQVELLSGDVKIQKTEDSGDGRSKDRKQDVDQKKMERVEICGAGQVSVRQVSVIAALAGGLDDNFEVLDK
uniref:G_PROTEIN_RECEP_F1_2 domain-containing protein n=1 Tax=Loa loa TaxID=7209 RepID=A0A1I7VM01_LOALO